MRQTIIGTGYYAGPGNYSNASDFMRDVWLPNTRRAGLVRCIDNSLWPPDVPDGGIGFVRISNNLGHIANGQLGRISQLQGWSMSWIIPALIAYSENCDFVYKEQDCLAFGDWLPQIRINRAAFGNHHELECEQSLFYIERDFIPQFVQLYMAIPEPDFQCIPERKFSLIEKMMPGAISRFAMGVGRSRPLPDDLRAQPWYAQKFTAEELQRLRREGLI